MRGAVVGLVGRLETGRWRLGPDNKSEHSAIYLRPPASSLQPL
jgi:hypothetical protein